MVFLSLESWLAINQSLSCVRSLRGCCCMSLSSWSMPSWERSFLSIIKMASCLGKNSPLDHSSIASSWSFLISFAIFRRSPNMVLGLICARMFWACAEGFIALGSSYRNQPSFFLVLQLGEVAGKSKRKSSILHQSSIEKIPLNSTLNPPFCQIAVVRSFFPLIIDFFFVFVKFWFFRLFN